eukprot:gene18051-21550_t
MKPSVCEQVDYEVELVVVIGKEGRYISKDTALEYVLGYTVGNDVSARDWQLRKPGGQWSLGKSFDTFAPIGPSIVVNPSFGVCPDQGADNIANSTFDPNNLDIRCSVNDSMVQNCTTREFIFTVQEVVSY